MGLGRLEAGSRAAGPQGRSQGAERFDVVVIGGGQAGLSVGYFLARRGVRFVILDASPRIGDSWRNRWDSLRLFTPARYDGLAGMPFPAPAHSFPTKDEMADYLEAYAKHFALPVRSGVRVDRLSREGDLYVVAAGARRFEAEHVVVAMASYQRGKVPPFARELDPGIVQLHSSAYRNPSQLREGGVLIVGAGNSGAEIALETAKDRPTWMSGRDTGHVPFRVGSRVARLFLVPLLFRFVFHRVLTVKTPIGRKVRPRIISQGAPLIRVKPAELEAAGVERVARVAGVARRKAASRGWPRPRCGQRHLVHGLPSGILLDRPARSRRDGRAAARERRRPGRAGLYFVGLHFLYAMSSTMIHGVERDAQRISEAVLARLPGLRAAGQGPAAA